MEVVIFQIEWDVCVPLAAKGLRKLCKICFNLELTDILQKDFS